ncbi:hypothetical protein LR48_Vigan07g197500 [Vigna angularis]|uniref:Uncharacterized protein n=2 Tax=Phaseolus angularis TaxID=3914 RepID=A0A0L9UZY7_PHAAN|nr:hypothetical protein LR48_Vigan07g197500 [Vigna angularis]BAT81882.1 hypothetical protein VIGAN_03179000 [Vigna angularis var. angularis]
MNLMYSMHRFCLHKYQNPTLCTSPDEFAAIVQCPGDRPNFDGEVCLCPHPPMMKESMLKKVVVSVKISSMI